MVNYSVSAIALLSLSCLVSTAINAESSERMRRVGGERKGLRKLFNYEHLVTDVQTECEFVATGTPKICVKVCVVVTSTTTEDGVIEEHSQVSQDMCSQGWETEDKETDETTTSPTFTHDDIDSWKPHSKDDSWKCAPKSVKVSSTA
jgi:hypothetical protein